jgi:hypothetical protein
MRTSIAFCAALTTLALVPATALADENPDSPNPSGYVAPQSVAYEGGKIPEGSTIEKKPNIVLVATGASIFGAAYAASLITAVAMCPPGTDSKSPNCGAGWLYLPIVGPFITAAQSSGPGGAGLAAFNGGVQVLGAALALSGFVAQKRFVVWQDKDSKTTLKVTPDAGAAPAHGDQKAGFNGGVSVTLTHL